MTLVQIAFHDPTPDNRIVNRYLAPFLGQLDKLDLDSAQRARLIATLMLVARKLGSVWRRLEDYRRTEDQLIAMVREPDQIDGQGKSQSELRADLYDACDAYLVQCKSALDHVAKVPMVIFGERVWSLRTFGDNGKNVLNALRRSVPQGDAIRLREIEGLFIDFKPWLEDVITLRDRVNHGIDGGLPFEAFDVRLEEDGRMIIPAWYDEITLREALGNFWGKLLSFIDQFTGAIVYLRLKSEWGAVGLRSESDDVHPHWRVLPIETARAAIRELETVLKKT